MKNKKRIQCQDEVSVKRNRSKDIFTWDKASKFLPPSVLSQGSSGQRWSTKIKLKQRWKFTGNKKSMGRRGESQDGSDRRGHSDRWVIRLRASQLVPVVKNPPTNAGDIRTEGSILGQEVPLEEGMATRSGILAWRIPWTEEPGGLQSTGSQRVGHNWVTKWHSRSEYSVDHAAAPIWTLWRHQLSEAVPLECFGAEVSRAAPTKHHDLGGIRPSRNPEKRPAHAAQGWVMVFLWSRPSSPCCELSPSRTPQLLGSLGCCCWKDTGEVLKEQPSLWLGAAFHSPHLSKTHLRRDRRTTVLSVSDLQMVGSGVPGLV